MEIASSRIFVVDKSTEQASKIVDKIYGSSYNLFTRSVKLCVKGPIYFKEVQSWREL